MKPILDGFAPALAAFFIQVTVVGVAALLAGWWFRRKGPAVQVPIYRAGIASMFGLLLLGPAIRSLGHSVWTLGPTPVATAPDDQGIVTTVTAEAKPAPAAPPSQVVPLVPVAEPPAETLTPGAGFAVAWIFGTAVLILTVSGGMLWLARVASSARRCRVPGVGPVVAEVGEIRSAFAAGIFRPTIFVPADIQSALAPSQVIAILKHEEVHVRHRDPAWTMASRLVCAIAWPNPVVWILARHLTASCEERCDQEVLQSGIAPKDYAGVLLQVAESFARQPVAAMVGAGVFTTKSRLSRRISNMLEKPLAAVVSLSAKTRILVVSLAAATAGGACLIASATPGIRHDTTPEATVQEMVNAFNNQDWNGVFSRVEGVALGQVMSVIDHHRALMGDLHRAVHYTLTVKTVETKGDQATIHVQLEASGLGGLADPNRSDDVHLVRLGGDWLVIDGNGPDSLFTGIGQLGRNPDQVSARMQDASARSILISHFKLICLAIIMYTGDHDDRYTLDQATMKARLKPYIKKPDVWNGPDGKPMDLRFNGLLTGRSEASIEQPANTVLISLGPAGNLHYQNNVTPIGFTDGHVKYGSRGLISSLRWK